MSNIKLSILIPSVDTRVCNFLPNIISSFSKQINDNNRSDVEILSVLDNRKITIGEKRNHLLNLSHGNFITFIDDDDRVDKDYIKEVMDAIDKNPDADCIVYDSIHDLNGKKIYCKYGIEYDYTYKRVNFDKSIMADKNRIEKWFGKPAHTMVWNSIIAKSCSFINKNSGEDYDWVSKAYPKIKKQIRIEKVLYYYDTISGRNY